GSGAVHESEESKLTSKPRHHRGCRVPPVKRRPKRSNVCLIRKPNQKPCRAPLRERGRAFLQYQAIPPLTARSSAPPDGGPASDSRARSAIRGPPRNGDASTRPPPPGTAAAPPRRRRPRRSTGCPDICASACG